MSAEEENCIKNILLNIEGENGPRLYSYLLSLEKIVKPAKDWMDLKKVEEKDASQFRKVTARFSLIEKQRIDKWEPFLYGLLRSRRIKEFASSVELFKSACTVFIDYDRVFRVNPVKGRRNWQIPVLVYVLRQVKETALSIVASIGGDDLQDLARCSRNLIMYCQNIDTDVEINFSRFKAIPFIVNTLLIVLSSFYHTDQCRSFVLAVEAMQKQGKPFLDCATKAQYVIYQFHLGRFRLLDRNFRGAQEALYSAFVKLPIGHPNKAVALYYCTFSSLLCRVKPGESLLRKHGLQHLINLITSVESGDHKRFQEYCVERKDELMERGVFTLIPYLTAELNLNSLVRCYSLSEMVEGVEPSRMPIECLVQYFSTMRASVELCSEEVLLDIISGILAAKQARGYLSREHKILVLSKMNPFHALGL